MPKTRKQKEEIVKTIADKLSRAKSVVFADYRGLNMSQLSELRKALREQQSEFTITKNNLLKLALQATNPQHLTPNSSSSSSSLSLGVEDLSGRFDLRAHGLEGLRAEGQLLEDPIATLFAYDDEITPLKTLSKLLKDTHIGSIKLGFLGQELLDASSIDRLVSLPSKDELRAKVVGSLGAPIYGIVGVLQANLRNLVYALEQIKKQKGGE